MNPTHSAQGPHPATLLVRAGEHTYRSHSTIASCEPDRSCLLTGAFIGTRTQPKATTDYTPTIYQYINLPTGTIVTRQTYLGGQTIYRRTRGQTPAIPPPPPISYTSDFPNTLPSALSTASTVPCTSPYAKSSYRCCHQVCWYQFAPTADQAVCSHSIPLRPLAQSSLRLSLDSPMTSCFGAASRAVSSFVRSRPAERSCLSVRVRSARAS